VDILAVTAPCDGVFVEGWVRTRRDYRDFSFLEVNDGSCLQNLQVVVPGELSGQEDFRQLGTGAAVEVYGDIHASPGKGQNWEMRAGSVRCVGASPEDYPLQKKRHSDEFLRTIAHLRPRTNKYGALFRLRSELAYALHHFLKTRGFYYIHTPIITSSDCEGAGEMFRVSTSEAPGTGADGRTASDFFGKPAFLTVSGQLAVEMFALSLGNVYTFGPTFRAENSNTSRHAAEFWMLEPEMAFCDLSGDMDLAEDMVRFCTRYVTENCFKDLELFARFVDKNLMASLETIASKDFLRVSYAEAVRILQQSGASFDYPPAPGNDLQTEHERYLSEVHFKQPLFVFDYPSSIKPFYMRLNDDGQTVAAMDLLVPRVGEIIGGSQREERHDVLAARIEQTGLNRDDYWWYLESRKYGSAVHSGFGLGFERLIMFMTGVANIRDVIPFPRTPGSIEY